MLKTLGVVEVHAAAGHPPVTRRLGNCSLVEWVVRRVSESQLLDGVLVILDDEPAQRDAARLLPPHVKQATRRGSDPLASLATAAREAQADAIVHVDVNQPFIDPEFIDRLVTTAGQVTSAGQAQGIDYISYCRRDGRPAMLSQIGVLGQWCRVESIERAHREATDASDRQDPLAFVRRHPELFPMRLIPVPAALDREDMRLVIDGEEDWERTELILDALGADRLDWQRITGLLEQQPKIRERMALLNRTRQ